MTENIELLDDDDVIEEDVEEETSVSVRGFNMEVRQRIEDKLEQRRLEKELADYNSYSLDDF